MKTLTLRGLMVGAVLLVAVAVSPATRADHLPEITAHCTYELGQAGGWGTGGISYGNSDPVGVTSDGYVNYGGCTWEFRGQEDMYDAVTDSPTVDGERTALQFAIVDDVFGTDVGAFFCVDVDGNAACGGEGDTEDLTGTFCGTSPVFEAPKDTDGDGHEDFGIDAGLWLHGSIGQAMFCDPSANPVGATSGGVLNPSGGVYMAMSG